MTVTFNGFDFETLFAIGDSQISILDSAVKYADSDAGNGTKVIGRRWATSTVSFALGVHGNAYDRREAFSFLGQYLNVDEPGRLVLPDTPDRYYLAIPDGQLDLQRGIEGEITRISFTIVDPIAYGFQQRTVTVPSGGSVTFNVGGTYATKPRVQATAVRNSSSLVWGLQLDGDDYVHVATGNASGRVTVIDCDSRTVTVSGNVSIITLDSDWLEFEPGSHTLAMDNGTGAATVTWYERWL